MIIRSVIHVMPWEIDHLFLLQHQLKRSSYYLEENDKFEMDVVLNLSDKLIDWDKSKLDKEFFIDKYKSTQYLTDWATCRYTIYEGDEMYGHLDLMKNCINDDIKCDAYMSVVPDVHFHETLLHYMFHSRHMSTPIKCSLFPNLNHIIKSIFRDILLRDREKINTVMAQSVLSSIFIHN